MEKSEEKRLVALASAGDKNAFRQLYDEYYQRVYNLAYSVMRSQQEAEEVLQEAFVKAYLGLQNFKGDSSFYTWIYRITRNMAIDVKRKKARRIQTAFEEPDYSRVGAEQTVATGQTIDPEEAYQSKEALSKIQKALGQLKEEQRTVIILREIEGMSYDDIAQTCGLSNGTVMSRLFYARKALKQILIDTAEDQKKMLANTKLNYAN